MKEVKKPNIIHVLSKDNGEVTRRWRFEGRLEARCDVLVLDEACKQAGIFAVQKASYLKAVDYR